MTELSLSAKAVLTAVTQQFYCLDPEDVPYCVSEYRSVISIALRAAADQLGQDLEFYNTRMIAARDLLAIATELEAQ